MRARGRFMETYGVLIAFAALFLIAIITQHQFFLKPENLRNLFSQNASVGILAVGMTLVIVGGGIDLSVGSMMALVAALMVLMVNKLMSGHHSEGVSVLVGIALCLVIGPLLGLINGLFVTFGRAAPFIVTLSGLVAFRSLTLVIGDGGEIRSSSEAILPALGEKGIPIPFIHVDGGGPLILTWPMLAFIAIAVIGGFLLNRTVYGRHLLAVGANPRAAKYSAIAVNKVKTITYVLVGLCVAFAAIGEAGRLGSVPTSTMGLYYELDAIAAVVIGGTSLAGGRGRIWSTVVGVLILGIIDNMLVLNNVSPYWQGCVKGAIILIAVLLQRSTKEEA